MHVGRPYPFHPTYYATEAWFYPGFVPWKLTLTVFDNSDPPWGIYTSGYGEVSQPGVCSPDNKSITYEFTHFAPAYGLIVRLDKFLATDGTFARWTCDLDGSLGRWGRAVNLQPFPQRVVFNRSWPIVINSIPYPRMGPPRYQFTPTDYHNGGSPFPNY